MATEQQSLAAESIKQQANDAFKGIQSIHFSLKLYVSISIYDFIFIYVCDVI